MPWNGNLHRTSLPTYMRHNKEVLIIMIQRMIHNSEGPPNVVYTGVLFWGVPVSRIVVFGCIWGGPKSRWNTQPQAGNSPCEQQKQQICYNAPPAPKINRPCHSCPLLPSPSPCLRHDFHVRDWQKLAQCVLTPTPSPCRGLLVWGLGAGNLES